MQRTNLMVWQVWSKCTQCSNDKAAISSHVQRRRDWFDASSGFNTVPKKRTVSTGLEPVFVEETALQRKSAAWMKWHYLGNLDFWFSYLMPWVVTKVSNKRTTVARATTSAHWLLNQLEVTVILLISLFFFFLLKLTNWLPTCPYGCHCFPLIHAGI